MAYLLTQGSINSLTLQAALPDGYARLETEVILRFTSRFTGRVFEFNNAYTVIGSWLTLQIDASSIPTEDDDYQLELVSIATGGVFWSLLIIDTWSNINQTWPNIEGGLAAQDLTTNLVRVQGNETFLTNEFTSAKDAENSREFISEKDGDPAREFASATDSDTTEEFESATDIDTSREFTSNTDSDTTKSYK